MMVESSGNGGRSGGSADSAAARVLWFYSRNCDHFIEPDDFKFRDPEGFSARVRVQTSLSTPTWRRLSAILNLSVSVANVQVENPNFYDFKYIDSRMSILYHGEQLGVGELGAGIIRSRNTVDLPLAITVEVVSFC